MPGSESSALPPVPPDLERLKVEGELKLKEAELELKKNEQEFNRKNVTFSPPVLIAVCSAVFGLLGTGLGAGLQGYWNSKLAEQKFEYELVTNALTTTDDNFARARLLLYSDIGLFNHLDAAAIRRIAQKKETLPLEFDRGRVHGAAVRRLLDSLDEYSRKHGRPPELLTDLVEASPSAELDLRTLRKENIRYKSNGEQGYVFTFAGQDGKLDTGDDRIYNKAATSSAD